MTFESKQSLWLESLSEFRNHIGAASPTPGGGAVAAVTAALAAALLRMVGAICIQRAANAKMKSAIEAVNICEQKLAQHADDDIQAFNAYIEARKNQTVASNVQEKLLACARVPLEAAEQVTKLQSFATEIAAMSPAFLSSDLATAQHLLHASHQALLANVATNLSNLEDCEDKRALQQRLELLVQVVEK